MQNVAEILMITTRQKSIVNTQKIKRNERKSSNHRVRQQERKKETVKNYKNSQKTIKIMVINTYYQ